MAEKKRAHQEPQNDPLEGKYGLEGTRYAGLQRQVQRMIRSRKTGGENEDSKGTSKNYEKRKAKKQKRGADSANSDDEHAFDNDQGAPAKRPKPERKEKQPPTSSQQPVDAKALPFVNENTVYVHGLPFSASEEDVRAFFAEAGQVLELRLPRWHDSQRLRGYGHVVFADAQAAEKAMEMSGLYLQDRFVTVDRPQVPRALQEREAVAKPPGCCTIFIKNLPYEVTEEEIRQQFMVYGPISSVRLAVWQHTTNLKGFGYIEFKREESADIAVRKSGCVKIRDRIITADFETGTPKAGYKGSKPIKK